MKNKHIFFVKALLVSTLFFSIPILLKADDSQKNTKSETSTLNRHLKEIQFNTTEALEEWKCHTECILNSNYPEFCKSKCKVEHLARVGMFKFKRFFEK